MFYNIDMQHVIYIDVYFLVNFFMNIIVLAMTGRFLRQKNCWYRLSIAAMAGTLSACGLFVWNKGQEGGFIGYFVFGITIFMMVLCAWGRDSKKGILYKIIACLLQAYLIGGVLNYFYYHTSILNQSSLVCWMLIITVIVLLLCCIWAWLEKELLKKEYYYEVSIKIGERIVHGTGFVDTGNHLVDPLSHQPVSVVSRHLLGEEQQLVESERVRMIPFTSVGKENGLMRGIRGDYMCVRREKKNNLIQNPILAIYEEKFSGKEKYDILLHPDCVPK